MSLVSSLETSAPWIILIGGVLFSFQIILLLWLKKKFREREMSLLRAEEGKQNLEKALLQGQKLQAIGTLAGGIAHDFNNVLYAISGYTEMAREDTPKDSMTYQNLGKVLEGCQRGKELIARILTFSRRQHHDFEPIALKSTIESALGLLRPTIPASVTIDFIADANDCVILGNQTQLHQVIVNMINNAVDAMDGEGKITLKLSATPPFCKIEMSDTGHGMDQTTMERMYEPFFTTKEVGKGTGLGLSTVHAIVSEHKGEISVNSQLGRGTTFTILLPQEGVPNNG